MRIAVDARVLGLPQLRGIGSYLCELLAAWPAPDDTFVLFSHAPIAPGRCAGPAALETHVVPQPRGHRFRVWDWRSLPRAVAGQAPDLFWGPANQAVPLGGLPQVVTVHDTLLQERVRHADAWQRLFHQRLSPWWLRRHAARVIAVSRFTQSRIEAVLGYPPQRTAVIPNGATLPPRPFPNREAALAYLQGQGLARGPFVLALGAESPWKNTAKALQAFALAARDRPDMDFLVAGAQPRAREAFKALGRQLGLGPRLRLLPFVERQDRDALYQAAAVFVYPSLFEGFGLPPLEAMALETPVVASDATAIPEVTGRAARLVRADDPAELARAILEVLSDPGAAQALVAAGLENIKRFSWSEAARAHRNLFKDCLSQ